MNATPTTALAPAPLPERPLPTPTRESQAFWDGMREGRFMVQHCHHPFNFFFKASAPYVVALVDMDAGVRVNAPLRGIAEADIKIGQRVKLGFEPVTKEITLPFFVAG
jgi:hypothetical protein